MPLSRRIPSKMRKTLERTRDMLDIVQLYNRLSRLDLSEKQIRKQLEKIHRKELMYAVERLAKLSKMSVPLSWHVETRWSEAVASWAHGQYNAALAMAADACELQLREQLKEELGNEKKKALLEGKRWRKTYGQILTPTYEEFNKLYPSKLSFSLWEHHKKMIENYRNPYFHTDWDTLAKKRDIETRGALETKSYKGRPRLHDPVYAFYDSIAQRLVENSPAAGALECLILAHSILHESQSSPKGGLELAMPDEHDERHVKKAVENAYNKLMKEDYELLKKDANERSLTHKFAEHLRSQFPDWHIDCEYNKDDIDPKRVRLEPIEITSYDDKGVTVYPDVIVHERGTSNNLLVIEAKKDTNSSDPGAVEYDRKKLDAYKKQLGYKFGLFLKFNTGDNYKERPTEEWF